MYFIATEFDVFDNNKQGKLQWGYKNKIFTDFIKSFRILRRRWWCLSSWSCWCARWSVLCWQDPNLGRWSAGQGRALGDLRAVRDVAFKLFHCLDGYSFFIKIVPVDGSPGKNKFLYSCCFHRVFTKTQRVYSFIYTFSQTVYLFNVCFSFFFQLQNLKQSWLLLGNGVWHIW